MATQLEAIADRLRSQLPGTSEDRIEIWLQDRPQVIWLFPFDHQVGAVTNFWTGRIHATDSSPDLLIELAHEMVHAMLGPSWDSLPPTLEEGLCDVMASGVVLPSEDLRSDRIVRAMAAAGGPPLRLRLHTGDGGWSEHVVSVKPDLPGALDLRDTFSRDSGQVRPYHGDRSRKVWYGLAYVAAKRLVDALGAEGLRELSRRAGELDEDHAVALFASAAGLGADASDWRDAIRENVDREVLQGIARRLSEPLARETLAIVSRRVEGGSPEQRAELARPRLYLEGVSEFVELLEEPAYAAALRVQFQVDRDGGRGARR
ncbi:MAG: protein DA1 [Planctomycetes bacterium]|nr:protein DA1 [Planctomycetota bacterium]